MAKYIAPRSLGSASDTTWERKNYTINHTVNEGDTDSLYTGTFFGFPFYMEINGADGDVSCYKTRTPTFDEAMNCLKKYHENPDKIDDFFDLDDLEPSDMPLDMKTELVIALLTHHQAQYDRWVREENFDSY